VTEEQEREKYLEEQRQHEERPEEVLVFKMSDEEVARHRRECGITSECRRLITIIDDLRRTDTALRRDLFESRKAKQRWRSEARADNGRMMKELERLLAVEGRAENLVKAVWGWLDASLGEKEEAHAALIRYVDEYADGKTRDAALAASRLTHGAAKEEPR